MLGAVWIVAVEELFVDLVARHGLEGQLGDELEGMLGYSASHLGSGFDEQTHQQGCLICSNTTADANDDMLTFKVCGHIYG